jgi:hypothetical protein
MQNVPFVLNCVIRNISYDRSKFNLKRAEWNLGLYWSNPFYTLLDDKRNWLAFSKADHNIKSFNKCKIQTPDCHRGTDANSSSGITPCTTVLIVTFRTNLLLPFLGYSANKEVFLDHSKDRSSKFLCNAGTYTPICTRRHIPEDREVPVTQTSVTRPL